MGLSSRVPSGADTYKFVPEIFLNKITDAVEKNLVAWDAINTDIVSGMKKGDTFYLTKDNNITATEVVVGTKGTSLNPFATSPTTLSISNWYEAPVDLDTMTMLQTQADMEGAAVRKCAYAIQEIIDTSVCTLFYGLGGYTTSGYGSDGQTLSDDILIYLKETLDEAEVPMDGKRSLILDPSGLADILKIDKLVSADYINKKGIVENGIIGNSVYGCVVRVTNNLLAATTGAYGCMLHKDAIVGLAQLQESWRKEFEELHQVRFHSEALWGVAEHQDSFGVPFFTRKK